LFYSLKGILIYTEPSFIVVECGGVGYKCYTTLSTQRSLPKVGQEVKIYTHMHVREDAMDLYGFITVMELNCYKMLTGVSGVGPKVGLAILSELTPEQVAAAIATNDSKVLTRAAGVGPKLAQRIVLELTDKVQKMDIGSNTVIPPQGIASSSTHVGEAVNALTVLGYSPTDAAAVVAKFDSALPVEELIRLSLKAMAGNL